MATTPLADPQRSMFLDTHPSVLELDADENQFLQAWERLHTCRQKMLGLMNGVPSIRDVINRQIKLHLDLDAEQTGVHFFPDANRSRSRISLTEACAFILQHPETDTTALPPGEVTSIPSGHRLAHLPLSDLLEKLKQIEVPQALSGGWSDYWASRSPGTGMSRRSHAIQLYKSHFEASAHLAQARSLERTDPLKPAFVVLDASSGELTFENQPLYLEQVFLTHTDGTRQLLTGSWIITRDSDEPVTQLLYVPFHEPAWQLFTQRTTLEQWLLSNQQAMFGAARTDTRAMLAYTQPATPVENGMAQWLTFFADRQYDIALTAQGPADLVERGFEALLTIEEGDQRLKDTALFSLPPPLPEVEGEAVIVDTLTFGPLSLELPASHRKNRVKQQRLAMQDWLGSDYSGSAQDPKMMGLKQQLDTLTTHQIAARTAAQAMLHRRTLDTQTLNKAFTELYHARREGLRAEANVQHTLKQLSDGELGWVLASLETLISPNQKDAVTVAALILTATQNQSASTQTTTTELKGPLVIAAPGDLDNANATGDSVLLYWPGSAGALQRFDSRQALENWLLGGAAPDPSLAIRFKPLSEDPFEYSLRHQQRAFDEEVATIQSTYSATSQAGQRSTALEALRLKTAAMLLVPSDEAREAAYLQIIEQNNSSQLATNLPDWLKLQADDKHLGLKALVQSYVSALQQANTLLERSLPLRDEYVKLQIDTRLRKDFSLTAGFSVRLELPDSVEQRREPIPGAAPGTPFKLIDVPSTQRSPMSLEELALMNLGGSVSLRLGFMTTAIQADDTQELATLRAGLTGTYLVTLVRELNLAQKYQSLIYDSFKGTTQETLFEREYRQECLLQPWRLTLQLQGECALRQRHIDADALRILNIAIDATHSQAWSSAGRIIRLLPAHLTAGGADTQNEGTTALFGVTFIEEQNSRKTLLYLPDAPDQRFLRSYPSLEDARKGLFNLCTQDTMVDYLAGRTLAGDSRAHAFRLRQAHEKRFDAMIGVGLPWPATTSLAGHLLNTQMGRLIEAHRNTSRSNADLQQEKYALQSGYLFNGIKIAIGFLPVIGTAVNLYDGATSLGAAVDAFREGETHRGVENLACVFDSLLYAAMDVVPAVGAPRAARQLTHVQQVARPLKRQAFAHFLAKQKPASHRLRFEGYAYEKPISLAQVHAESHGVYRQVYRHPEGDFIISRGRIYQVEYDKTYHTLRLSGTRSRHYKQPIALDDSGQWDTHGALYGTLVEGGLSGGGNVVGHLADRLEPWTAPFRQWLPRWWTDRALRQQQAIMARIKTTHTSLNTSAAQVNRLLVRYHADDLSVIPELERAMDTLSAQAMSIDTDFVNIAPYTRGNRAHVLRKARSDAAEDICQCAQLQVEFNLHKEIDLYDAQVAAEARLAAHPYDQLSARQVLRAEVRRISIQIFENYRRTDTSIELMNQWLPQVQGRNRNVLTTAAEVINRRNTVLERARLKTFALTDLIVHRKPGHDMTWHYLQSSLRNAENDLLRAVYLHVHLLEASPNPAQRNRILQQCIDAYTHYQRQMSSWAASVPQHFDDTYIALMRQQLDILRERAQTTMTTVAPRTPHTSNKRVFETDDNMLLIGEPSAPAGTQARRYTLTGKGGVEEVWEQGSNGKFHRVDEVPNIPWHPAPGDLKALIQEAKNRLGNLASHQAKVHGYARQNMLPSDLEFMMTSEADALELYARHIDELKGDSTLVRQLRQKASELHERGRQLRITQILKTQTPTEGYLDYLMSQQLDGKPILDIRKTGPLEELGRRQDGRPDFLQEYEIRDLRPTSPAVLWYAHFHYESKAPKQFDMFNKAHLKMPAQRRLGLNWQRVQEASGTNATPIWRGNINKPFARMHFQALFE